jgi:toxin ParE1/3/4
VSERSSARSWGYDPRAGAELVEEIEYLCAEDREIAAAFEVEVTHAIEQLLEHPEIGMVVRKRGGLRFRKWPLQRFRYSLIYALVGEELRIYAVAHHRRAPDYWLSRLRAG